MFLEKENILYTWMAVYSKIDTSGINHFVFGDESIDKTYKSQLFSKWLSLTGDSELFAYENRVSVCIFKVPGTVKESDWDNVSPVAFICSNLKHENRVVFVDMEYLSETLRSEKLFISILLQCAVNFGCSHFSNTLHVQELFQNYWNGIVQEVPYAYQDREIVGVSIEAVNENGEPGIIIDIEFEDNWNYRIPYTQKLLKNIIS